MERRVVMKARAAREKRGASERRGAVENRVETDDGGAFETRVAFCSACDRNVPVLVEAPDWSDRAPSVRDVTEAVVCLDYGVRCTGAMCPMFRKAPPRRVDDVALPPSE